MKYLLWDFALHKGRGSITQVVDTESKWQTNTLGELYFQFD